VGCKADSDNSLTNSDAALRVNGTRVKYALGKKQEQWRPGKRLKLVLASYVGAQNTGADVRVEETIRQFRTILTDEHIELTIMTLNREFTAGYFRTVRQMTLPHVFPHFLFSECPRHHGVVACEGSMFKSKFSNALSIMMTSALGLAAVENKVSVGYGAEAGAMDASLKQFVRRHCKDSLIICRNERSRSILKDLDIRSTGGTDTAWTFEPAPLTRGAELLYSAGWDGHQKILVVCPINPFWWPIKPDIFKAVGLQFSGSYRHKHYKSIYFHQYSKTDDSNYNTYLDSIATAVNAFSQEKKLFTILVGMERLDRLACIGLASRLSPHPPLFISDEHDMYDLVSILRNCSLMVSSRFHAIVTSMPGLIPSIGITMDERIRNLMDNRGHADFCLEVDEENLAEKLLTILRRLERESESIADDIGRIIPHQLQLMGQMGIEFVDEIARVYPEFPRRNVPRSWEYYIPPLSDKIDKLLEVYG
jgi:polysaccharide pyruvyl transferase WcaK-like protein